MIRALAISFAVAACALLLAGAGFGAWRAAAAKPVARNPACSGDRVAAARAAFKAAYDAGRFADAAGAIEPLWADCASQKGQFPAQTAGEIVNDLAIADHRSGDDHECLEALEDYWPANRAPTPAFARLSPALQRAMRFNWSLCQSGCADVSDVDAVCESLETNDQLERRVLGFRRVACPFQAGASAVALPDGTCLAVLAPRRAFDVETALGPLRARVCPTAVHLAQAGGKIVSTPLAVPAKSYLNSPQFCCHPTDLAIDASGRISAQPHGDWIDGCVSGHPAGVMQDIFRLEGGRLVMVGQLDEAWFPDE